MHVLIDGRIARSGGKELALELERKGYEWGAQGDRRGRSMSRARREQDDRREWYLDCFREFEQRLNGGAGTPPSRPQAGGGRPLRGARAADQQGRELAPLQPRRW